MFQVHPGPWMGTWLVACPGWGHGPELWNHGLWHVLDGDMALSSEIMVCGISWMGTWPWALKSWLVACPGWGHGPELWNHGLWHVLDGQTTINDIITLQSRCPFVFIWRAHVKQLKLAFVSCSSWWFKNKFLKVVAHLSLEIVCSLYMNHDAITYYFQWQMGYNF